MKEELDPNKVGLLVGVLAGLGHTLWAILVALGLAQLLLDWIYGLHFLNNPFTVGSFDLIKAAILVLVTSVLGYAVGWILATIWNTLLKREK